MRLIIKNADFSEVSIGKVSEDLSFHFDAHNGVLAINSFFPNYNSGTPTETDYYSGSSGGTVTMAGQTNARLVSDYHEVSEGMTVEVRGAVGGWASVPLIITFDASKNIVSSACVWQTTEPNTLTVPSGVKYVKIQLTTTASSLSNLSQGVQKVNGTMP